MIRERWDIKVMEDFLDFQAPQVQWDILDWMDLEDRRAA